MTITAVNNVAQSLASATANSAVSGSADASSASSSSSSSSSTGVGSQSYFLTLLIAQMNNQDPLNPMDSSEMTSQLAQINTVSGIQQLSTQLTSLLSTVSATQTTQDAALIGQQVVVPGNALTLTNGQANAAISLPESTTTTTLAIKNTSGATVKTIELGAQAAGTVPFTWDGTMDNGAVAPAGNYSFAVTALSGNAAVTGTTLSEGTVSAVVPGASGAPASITVGTLGTFNMSQVNQIQ